VNPDIVSKKAFVKLGMAPEMRKGRHPNNEKNIQPRVTMPNPSRALKSLLRFVSLKKRNPVIKVIPAEIMKYRWCPSP
jgi:hypothetical protein